MNEPDRKFDELRDLVARMREEQLTPSEAVRLKQILTDSAEARKAYAEYVALGALLELEVAAIFPDGKPADALRSLLAGAIHTDKSSTITEKAGAETKKASSPVLGFLGGAFDYVNHSRMLMFSLIALMLSGWFIFQIGSLMVGRSLPGAAQLAGQSDKSNSDGANSPNVSHLPGGSFADSAPPRPSNSLAPTTTAFVTALVDCHWRVVLPAAPSASAPAPGDADTVLYRGEPFHVGSELSAGRQLDLVHGLAEITFRSGAQIVLNGPAHFTVGSPLGGKLQIGKLTARVPHDVHGFTVNTPAGKVVDLGTEFGVAVAADHTMNVEVFVGEVAVDASSADGQTPGSPSTTPTLPQKLTAGHAVHVEAGKPVASIPLDPKRFVRGLGPREDSHVAQTAYLDFVRSLKPVVWFRMEGKDTDRVLHDEMGGPDAKLNWDGPGNPFVEGHVGKGLWLRGSKLKDGAIVPSYPPAAHGKLTVAAWVYADRFPPSFSPAVCNWADTNGVGQFYFGLLAPGGGNNAVLFVDSTLRDGRVVMLAEPATRPFPLYDWQHVAFTSDGATMRLYRQGREVASMPHAGLQYPVRLKALGIGVRPNDAGSAASDASPNNWDGKLDEIAVFNDTLTADDIRKLAAPPPQ